ncbi:MAG: HAMP domain-containing protein [Alphaproteobacteria bacterium]|nr:HAMP domain-containing protein [Alphaproteobacteria bacterium]
MRLWLRVALVVAVVSVAALLLTGIVAIRVAGETATVTAERAQERDAAAVAMSVQRWVADREATLRGWAQTFPLGDYDEARREGLTRAVLSAIPSAVVVTLVDEDGQEVVVPAHFTEETVPPGALAATPSRAARLRGSLPVTEAVARETAVGEPFTGDGLPSVPIAVVASSDPILVLGAELALDIVQELEGQSSREHAVALLDRHGEVLGADPRGHVDRLLERGLVRSVLGTVASITYERQGMVVQGAVAPVGETGWTVVVLEPADVALEGPRRIRRLLPVVVGAAMVLAVLLALVLARTVTDPIARLRDHALALADGRLGITTEVARSDEVGELARAFNHLSMRLRENQDEIRQQREAIESFNQDLQREVEAATAHLREAQEQLVRSGQLAAVAQIGAGLAHELNNPLTAVLGLAQILRARTGDPALAEDLQALEQEALRCREVVDALLKLADDQPATQDSHADLRAILEDVVTAVRPTFARRGVGLSTGAYDAVDVRIGHGPAAQALVQLMSGLAAGLPSGARLAVGTEVVDGLAIVRLVPSAPVELASDDWMASGVDVWVARQTLDRLGADLVEPLEPDAPWLVRLHR